MRRAIALVLMVITVTAAACSNGSSGKRAKGPTGTSTSTTSVAATTAGDATTAGTAPEATVFTPPTLPKAAPAGAVPFDIYGAAGAVEPTSGMLGVVLGPLPNGFVLVEAKSAAVTGVATALVGLEPGTPVHVVGYAENVNGLRLITATSVDSGPQAVPH